LLTMRERAASSFGSRRTSAVEVLLGGLPHLAELGSLAGAARPARMGSQGPSRARPAAGRRVRVSLLALGWQRKCFLSDPGVLIPFASFVERRFMFNEVDLVVELQPLVGPEIAPLFAGCLVVEDLPTPPPWRPSSPGVEHGNDSVNWIPSSAVLPDHPRARVNQRSGCERAGVSTSPGRASHPSTAHTPDPEATETERLEYDVAGEEDLLLLPEIHDEIPRGVGRARPRESKPPPAALGPAVGAGPARETLTSLVGAIPRWVRAVGPPFPPGRPGSRRCWMSSATLALAMNERRAEGGEEAVLRPVVVLVLGACSPT